MATTSTNLICSNFGGIRNIDSVFSSEKITASDLENVELFNTGLNTGVGIRTALGNKAIYNLEEGEEVIGIFESVQATITYFLVYTETENEGKLYVYQPFSKTLEPLVGGLKTTGKACGTDYVQGWTDYFIFSNGEDIVYIYSDKEQGVTLQVDSEGIKLKDPENRQVKGLGLSVFDSRLWIFDGQVLWYSEQSNCKNFQTVDTESELSPGFIEFVKNITAIYPYLGALAVFHKDSSCLIQTDATTKYKKSDESPGGCANYNSLVFHGTDLYFYDDTKKGVFSFQQVVNGDKTLSDNIALNIQSHLIEISKKDLDQIRALSVVTSDRNEVWFLVPISTEENRSIIMIYDYIRNEWLKRKCQKINCFNMVEGTLYSGGKTINEEYNGNTFGGEHIPCYYICSIFNLGADNTLKVLYFPPRVTVDSMYTNHFFVSYVRNYDSTKKIKEREIKNRTIKNVLYFDVGYWDKSNYMPRRLNAISKLPSATFKALEIKLFTKDEDQEFCIKNIEFSRIKVKQV